MEWNTFDLDPRWCDKLSAKYVILPIAYECTTSYLKGTQHGPEAIVEASHQVELYDEVCDAEPYKAGIWTAPPMHFKKGVPEQEALAEIKSACENLLREEKFVISLGGEHTVSVPLVKAHAQRYPGLHVLHLDAHADLRAEYHGSPHNHACTMARVREVCPAVSAGVRSLSREEHERIQREQLPVFFAYQLLNESNTTDKILQCLGNPIYVTIDLDVFDPSEAPGVGTPEPGGLGWYDVLAILAKIARHRRVVGFDVVELLPRPIDRITDFLAAKLVFRILGLIESTGSRAKKS